MVQTVCDMMPYLENMAADISIRTDFPSVPVRILANRTLLESLVTNLAVQAQWDVFDREIVKRRRTYTKAL